jgi:hypothetical protein
VVAQHNVEQRRIGPGALLAAPSNLIDQSTRISGWSSKYRDSEDGYLLRVAHVNVIVRKGYRSLSDFIADSVMKKCARLRAGRIQAVNLSSAKGNCEAVEGERSALRMQTTGDVGGGRQRAGEFA